MNVPSVKNILEAVLFAASESLSIVELQNLFIKVERPSKIQLKEFIEQLQQEYVDKPIELIETSSGYRFQVKTYYSPWVSRLWEEKPAKYSRAMLETLAIIAYQQPVTRGDIENIRGVAVSSQLVRILLDRKWVRVSGHKDVLGKPALYSTTAEFLDYFNLKTIAELPEMIDLDTAQINRIKQLGEEPQ